MLAGLNVGRYRDNSVELTKFAHIGKFKNDRHGLFEFSSKSSRSQLKIVTKNTRR